MKAFHQVLFTAGLLLVGVVTWRILTPPVPQADWLQVESPRQVTPGETLTLRVTLLKPDPQLKLIADLHGWTRRKQPLRTVSHTAAQSVDPANPTLEFKLRVPEGPDLANLRAIIYLSPTASWHDRVQAVTSDEIPVKARGGSTPAPSLQPLPVHEQIPDPAIPRQESKLLRFILVGLWSVVALGLGLKIAAARTKTAAPPMGGSTPMSWLLLTASLGAVMNEIFRLEVFIGEGARNQVLKSGLYEERLLPQEIAVTLIVVGLVAAGGYVLVRARNRRLVIGLLAYATIMVIAALSLHDTDAMLFARVLDQPIEQIAKFVTVCVSLWGLLQSPSGRLGPVASSD